MVAFLKRRRVLLSCAAVLAGSRLFDLMVRRDSGGTTVYVYGIVAGNTKGPIVNVVGVGDISGTANASTAMANFQY